MIFDKFIGSSLSLIKYRLFKIRSPISVNVHLTNRCTHKCSYCDIWRRKTKEMTTQQVFSLVDQLKKLGNQRIGYTGGEPLLRDDIKDIVDYTKKKKVFVTLASNCYLVKKEKIDDIKNIDVLATSLQGPEEIHDKQIGCKVYKRLIEAISLARNNGISVWNLMVLTKYNLKYVDFMIDKAKELDFYLHFQPVHEYAMSSNTVSSVSPDKVEYKEVIKKIISIKKKERKKSHIHNSIKGLKYLYDYPILKKKLPCIAGYLYFYIGPNGNIYPCHNLVEKIKVPNFLEIGLKKSINTLNTPFCKGCWCQALIEQSYISSLNIGCVLNALSVGIFT